ncbi:MAG: ABC transporter ATP-binding protein [Actinomycetota bacterium]
MIRVVGLSVAVDGRPDRRVLRDLHLDVVKGCRVGIVGESGCGKSTLLRSLTGACGRGLVLASGTVEIGGRDMFALPEAERRALMGPVVALVPQGVALSLTPHLDVAAHFRDVYAAGVDGAGDVRDRAVVMLDEVGLRGAAMVGRFPHELSGGEQQRVLIALGLARDPEVLLLDEPTSALDVGVAHDILALIEEEHRRRGFTMVCVSHDLGVIDRIAEHVVVMNDGEIVEEGPRDLITGTPTQPYTRRLLAAAPRLGVRHDHRSEGDVAIEPLVTVAALTVVRSSSARRSVFGPRPRTTTALQDLTLEVRRGEILGIIGESGSGKSTFLKTICGLLPPSGGSLRLEGGVDLGVGTSARPNNVLQRIQMVFQNPDDSLNPAHTVRRILAPGRVGRKVAAAELEQLLHTVGLGPGFLDRMPAQLSGGEKQRVAIARALARKPELLLLDEVTSALDVTVQAGVLATLLDIHRALGTTMVFVSHDIAVVSSIADRIAVLHGGKLVELADAATLIDGPADPYTARLVSLARRSSV